MQEAKEEKKENGTLKGKRERKKLIRASLTHEVEKDYNTWN